jgi:hypothetical protein
MMIQPKEMTVTTQPHDEDDVVIVDDTEGPEQADTPGEDEA